MFLFIRAAVFTHFRFLSISYTFAVYLSFILFSLLQAATYPINNSLGGLVSLSKNLLEKTAPLLQHLVTYKLLMFLGGLLVCLSPEYIFL